MTQPTTTRRAAIGALLAAPTVAALGASAAIAVTGDDSELLAAFAAYQRAYEAFEGNRIGEAAFFAAHDAMDLSPEPTTLQGAAVKLRFALGNCHSSRELQRVSLTGTPAERAAYYRANPDELDADDPHIAGAIIALETLAA